MPLTGQLFIGRDRVATAQTFRAANPTTASLIDPPFSSAGDAEVARARAQLKVSLLMGMERPGTRAEQIAGQLFALGHIQSAAEITAQLEAIDAGAVKRYASRVMAAPTIAAVGPVKKLETYDRFAARFAPLASAAE